MQILNVSENQFAGDELMLLTKNVLPYSYVTKGRVVAYEISGHDLKELPKEFQLQIEKMLLQKLEFVQS